MALSKITNIFSRGEKPPSDKSELFFVLFKNDSSGQPPYGPDAFKWILAFQLPYREDCDDPFDYGSIWTLEDGYEVQKPMEVYPRALPGVICSFELSMVRRFDEIDSIARPLGEDKFKVNYKKFPTMGLWVKEVLIKLQEFSAIELMNEDDFIKKAADFADTQLKKPDLCTAHISWLDLYPKVKKY
ncbi:hypothetical protein KEM56_000338 [Ascosphaera pollenicola]|nr:hypothetical protein KEM56_000338 [Ascosphaera pollenicola]